MRERLGVESLDDLARALDEQRVRSVPGFGAKVERRIAEGLARYRDVTGFMNLSDARRVVLPLVERIRRRPQVLRAEVAGDLRRSSDVVRSPAIVVACRSEDAGAVLDAIAADDAVSEVLRRWADGLLVRIDADVPLDARTCEPDCFGAAVSRRDGLGGARRARGRPRLRVSSSCATTACSKPVRASHAREEDVYRALDLAYVPPELREDAGEIEAAIAGRLPRLLRLEDVRGDLHAHTTASDGRASIESMARRRGDRGYEYLAITDHTKSTKIANGLDEQRLLAHLDAIERANERVPGIRLLKSAEVDILRDGSLDLPDEILARLDLRVCSLHALLKLPAEEQTERVLTAMRNRYFNVLGHPTGRVLGHRDPSPMDVERSSARRGARVPRRAQCTADASRSHARVLRLAKKLGVKVVISTDSHSTEGLAQMEVGVALARRAGWKPPTSRTRALGRPARVARAQLNASRELRPSADATPDEPKRERRC
jgi:DNA polymerase (family 10)